MSLATLVPQDAFSTPWFGAVAALLTLSVTACAWERTGAAWRDVRRVRSRDEKRLERLRKEPHIVLAAPGLTAEEAMEAAVAALKGSGLRTTCGPSGIACARANRLGLLGSPLMHWSLAALLAVAAAGQLTRSEGLVDLLPGETKADVASSYSSVSHGPGFRGHSGLRLSCLSITPDLVVEGVRRGGTPIVRLSAGSRVLREHHVYPNKPLRWGRLMVHREEIAPVLRLAIESDAGSQVVEMRFPRGPDDKPAPCRLDLKSPQRSLALVLVPLPGRRVEVTVDPDGERARRMLSGSRPLEVASGLTLRALKFGSFARLRVVDDWSIAYIYMLFVLVTVGGCLAMFLPPREVFILTSTDAEETSLRVLVRATRIDVSFRGRLERALFSRFGAVADVGREVS